jgi:hypothetical protein
MLSKVIDYVLNGIGNGIGNGIRKGMGKLPFAKSYSVSEVVKLGRWGYHWEVNSKMQKYYE